jgi:protein tyrosine phosphatase
MLAAHRPSVLVILASRADIETRDLCPYYARTACYESGKQKNRIQVSAEKNNVADDVAYEIKGLVLQRYAMTVIPDGDKPVFIPVLHVENWLDNTTLNVDQLEQLASKLNRFKEGVPFIHCVAGVGRSAQLVAARALLERTLPPNLSLQTILIDMRTSRNPGMLESETQVRPLVELSLRLGRPVS